MCILTLQQSQPAFGAGASATMFSVGCSGFFSVKGEVRQGMAVANGLLVATMLGQVGLLLFVFTDNPWKRDLPGEDNSRARICVSISHWAYACG